MRVKKELLIPFVLLIPFLVIVWVVVAVANLGTGINLKKDTVLKVPARNATMRLGDETNVGKVEVQPDSIKITTTAVNFDLLSDSQIFASVRNKNLQSSDPAYQVTYNGTTGIISFAPPTGDHTLTGAILDNPTPTPTSTPPITPTPTPTPTPTSIPTPTPSPSVSPTATPTPTPTPRPSASMTPSLPPTPITTPTLTPTPTLPPPAGCKKADLNCDGKINIFDASILMTNWGKTGSVKADLNGDGKVNIFDASIMMSNWGK